MAGNPMKAFKCRKCGECCYGEGGIFLEGDEGERIARFMGTGLAPFLSNYCENRHGRTYIKSGPDGFCVFYDRKKSCLIHPVKPRRCALWPFYPALLQDEENWEMAKNACPGINPACTFAEFIRQAKSASENESSTKGPGDEPLQKSH
jgi:Fe-S-cluster containining protein